MVQARLFIKSKRTTIVTGKVSVESMGATHWSTDYSEGATLSSLSQEDTLVRNMLRNPGCSMT
jgi:hypothetical protein